MLMKRFLSTYSDLKLVCVKNGLEAVKMMDCENPNIDLILMDCNMPIMDGYKATKEIRALSKKHCKFRVPIVAVTANVMQSDLDRCLTAGMNDYITKPFRKEDIRKKIDKFIIN